jgi:hypothetical protein
MRKDRTKLQINRQLRRRPLLDQIRPHGLAKIKVSKIAFVYLRLFFRLKTFQWVSADKNKKNSSPMVGSSDMS